MTPYASHVEEIRALRSSRARVAELLGGYPHLSQADRGEILDFLKEGRQLDIGLLTSDEKLRPQLDAFMADHQHHFRIGAGDIARLAAVLAAALTVCWILWELVRPAVV